MDEENENTTLQLIKDQQREIKELNDRLKRFEAFDVLRLKLAHDKIKGAGIARFKASGVIVEIKSLSGEGITGAFGVSDGLSAESIEALLKDIERTFKSRFEMNNIKEISVNTQLMFK